jgi:uncharacterized protein (DUF486 family)
MAGAEMESGGLEKNQGDQIGRIFAGWAIASIGYFLKVPEVAKSIGLIVATVQVIR